jgi:hypothetical protein
MDLDHRAAEAAAQLRDEVDAEVDLDTAYGRVLAGVGRRRSRTAGVRIGVAALVGLVAVGALAVVTIGAGPGGGRTGDADRYEELALEDGITARGAAILGGLPDGPLDGRESWRLPVVADRADGLHEGDEITLYGKGFEPGESVGAVHCSSEADTANGGVGACDLGDASYAFAHTVGGTARYDGSVAITVPVRRFITTPDYGPVDCASLPERCLLAIGAASDYDRSGGTYINFADAPPFPEPSVAIDPPGPYTAGQEVTVQAAGLVAGRQYQVEQCVGDEHCASLAMGRASAEGTYGATVAIGSAVEVDGVVEDCGNVCTLAVRGVGLPDQTTADPPAPIPLGPIAGEGTVAAAPTTTTPPDPATATEPPSTLVEGTVPPSTEVGPGTTTVVPGPTTAVPTPPTSGPPGTGDTTTTTG